MGMVVLVGRQNVALVIVKRGALTVVLDTSHGIGTGGTFDTNLRYVPYVGHPIFIANNVK